MKLRTRLLVLLGAGVALAALASVLAAGARKDLGIPAGGTVAASARTQSACSHECASCSKPVCTLSSTGKHKGTAVGAAKASGPAKGLSAGKRGATCGATEAPKKGAAATCSIGGSCGTEGTCNMKEGASAKPAATVKPKGAKAAPASTR